MYDICVVGLGYVGLPTAALFASAGERVLGVDVNAEIIDAIQKYKYINNEKDLQEIVNSAARSRRLVVSDKLDAAKNFIICVPTPLKNEKPDMSYLISAIESIIPVIKKEKPELIVVESTIPPRTMDNLVCNMFAEENLFPGKDFHLAYCPERVLPGNTVREICYNYRIMGGLTKECANKAASLYRKISRGLFGTTDLLTAELAKLYENSYRLVNIALANELSDLCIELGGRIREVLTIANCHNRVNILKPGTGIGGHCIPIDPYFLSITEKDLIYLALKKSELRPQKLAQRIMQYVTKDETVTVYGLTYKGNTNDIRNSPAIQLYKILKQYGLRVNIYDPHVSNKLFPELINDFNLAAHQSTMLIFLADHNEFKTFDPYHLSQLVKEKRVFDAVNVLNPWSWRECGFVFLN